MIDDPTRQPPPDWNPAPHPEPPHDLDHRDVPLIDLEPPWYQCFGIKRGALNFNPRSSGRFNAPSGEFAVTYLSTTPEGAFAEKFLQSGRQRDHGMNVMTRATLSLHRLCSIAQPGGSRPLRLVDLTGSGLSHLNADGRLSMMTDDPGLPLRWSLALWRHPAQPDGLLYIARHDPSCRSIAVFDRARHLLIAELIVNLLADDETLGQLLARYQFGLIDD